MKNFNQIYENVYKESNAILEYERKETLKRKSVIVIIGIIAAIILKQLMMVVIALFLCTFKTKKHKEYTKIFKEKVIKTFIKEYDPNLEFNPCDGILKTTYIEGQFEWFDTFDSEDLIQGKLEGKYDIIMSEVHTQKTTTDSEGRSGKETVFIGLFAKIKLDKVVPNINIRRNGLYAINPKNRIEMDSEEFEKIFNAYGDDPIITMQLFTADILQMLVDFKKENKIMPEITISEDNLYIRFHTGEVFEAKILKKALDYETLLKYYKMINFTFDLTKKITENIKETEI